MTALIPLLVGVLTLFYTGGFAAKTWVRSGSLTVRTRIGLVTTFMDSVLALVLAHVLIPWANLSTALWLLPVALVAAGVAGAVLRWTSLPAVGADRSARRQIAFGAGHVIVVVVIVVLLMLL